MQSPRPFIQQRHATAKLRQIPASHKNNFTNVKQEMKRRYELTKLQVRPVGVLGARPGHAAEGQITLSDFS